MEALERFQGLLGEHGPGNDDDVPSRRVHNNDSAAGIDHDYHHDCGDRTGHNDYDNHHASHDVDDRSPNDNDGTDFVLIHHIVQHVDHGRTDDDSRPNNDRAPYDDSANDHGRPVVTSGRTIAAMSYETHPDDLAIPGEPAYRADQLRRWLYQTPVLTPAQMTNLPTSIREHLGESHWPFAVEAELSADRGATRKWLFRTPDGASIEAVVMGYEKRTTICISSQAGCAMACTFCATGQFGFERHLTSGEIVAQVAYANAGLRDKNMTVGRDHVTSIVFMGMGEPLANYANVREAIRRMIEVMGVSPRHITVSTVGIVPAIYRLAEEPWPLNLAVSLHAADDETRSSIVPINKRYPIHALTEACAAFFEKTGRRVSIEWTLIAGTNDSADQAQRLGAIALGMSAHVNVIPLNPTPLSSDRPPDADSVERFKQAVARTGVTVTIRNTRGREIDAACGQLRSQIAVTG